MDTVKAADPTGTCRLKYDRTGAHPVQCSHSPFGLPLPSARANLEGHADMCPPRRISLTAVHASFTTFAPWR